jgi:hypothetical protein
MPEVVEIKYNGKIIPVEYSDEEVDAIKEETQKECARQARHLLRKYNLEVEDEKKKVPIPMLAIILERTTRHYHFKMQSMALLDRLKKAEKDEE